jgi:hypothetical protein
MYGMNTRTGMRNTTPPTPSVPKASRQLLDYYAKGAAKGDPYAIRTLKQLQAGADPKDLELVNDGQRIQKVQVDTNKFNEQYSFGNMQRAADERAWRDHSMGEYAFKEKASTNAMYQGMRDENLHNNTVDVNRMQMMDNLSSRSFDYQSKGLDRESTAETNRLNAQTNLQSALIQANANTEAARLQADSQQEVAKLQAAATERAATTSAYSSMFANYLTPRTDYRYW